MSYEIKTREAGQEIQCPCCGKWIGLEYVASVRECPACNTRIRLTIEVLQ